MAFTFGNPNLFAQGVVEQTLYDPTTGDVLGYDRVGSDAALNYTFDFTEITGGFNNQLVGLIPHTTRLAGTYTSAAFSMEQRALLSGGALQLNGITPIVETIQGVGQTLGFTISHTPVSIPGTTSAPVCYVREKGAATYDGVAYGFEVEPTQGTNVYHVKYPNQTGKTYEVFYFTKAPNAQQLGLPVAANPSVVTVVQKWGIYAAQNGGSKKAGTLQGFLYVIVPKAQLEGDAGMTGNQTTNTTTAYNWRAISSQANMPSATDCDQSDECYGYYVYVPCGDAFDYTGASLVVLTGISDVPFDELPSDGTIDFSRLVKISLKDGTLLDVAPREIESVYLAKLDNTGGNVHSTYDDTSGSLTILDNIEQPTEGYGIVNVSIGETQFGGTFLFTVIPSSN